MGFIGKSKKFTEDMLMNAANAAYDKAVGKLPLLASPHELADEYMRKKNNNIHKAVTSLVRWQTSKAGMTGFVTGIPGGLTAVGTIPADITTCLYIQLRMCAAIAVMSGETDLHSDQVKTMCLACLLGDSVTTPFKQAGIVFGKKVATNFIKNNITRELITRINQAVGFRLVTKFGSTGVINLGKLVPVVGGIIGGAFDTAFTYATGRAARIVFL